MGQAGVASVTVAGLSVLHSAQSPLGISLSNETSFNLTPLLPCSASLPLTTPCSSAHTRLSTGAMLVFSLVSAWM